MLWLDFPINLSGSLILLEEIIMNFFMRPTKKLLMGRGDAIGGAMPLIVIRSESLSEMKPSRRKNNRKYRKSNNSKHSLMVYIIIIGALTALFWGGLLGEGPKL